MDDKIHIPIQAADLLAYETTKVYEEQPRDPNAAQRRLKSWLGRHMTQSAYMDARYIRRIVNANYDRVKAFKERHAFQEKAHKQAQQKSKSKKKV